MIQLFNTYTFQVKRRHVSPYYSDFSLLLSCSISILVYGICRGALPHGYFECLYPNPTQRVKGIWGGGIFTVTLSEQAHELWCIPKFLSFSKLSDLVTHKLPKGAAFMDPPA